jgi:hypothetical protein
MSAMGGKRTLANDVIGTHAQELLNEHGAGAVPHISALMLVEAYATFKLDRERSPQALSNVPLLALWHQAPRKFGSSI